MPVQTRVNNTNLPLCLNNGKTRDNFTVKQYVTGVLLRGQVMGKEMVIIGTATADGGNTGNGTVTGLALHATGAPAKIGSYILICTDAELGDALTGTAAADGGNTGNGTVTSIVTTLPAKQGAYILTCRDDSVNDTIAVGNVSGPTGTGNGTLTEEAADSLGAPAKQGSYILTCIETITNGGRFQLADPDGIIVASDILIAAGAGGVIVFVGAGVTFKITDGGTDFVAGDYFGFDVTGAHGGRFELADPDGNIVHDNLLLPGGTGGTLAVDVDGVAFTLTDGGTDFATDDFFTITVTGANGGRFRLTDPDGIVVKDDISLAGGAGGTVVFTGAGMTFTITDGGTDFAVDDFFTITTTAGVKLIPVTDAATTDGSQLPLYILGEEVDATGGDITGEVAYIEGDFDAQQLAFEGTATLATDIKIGNVEKTIREWLQDVSIVAIDSTYPDEFENT